MNDFVVRVDIGKLNAKQAAQLSSAIQGAVLAQLAALDLKPESKSPYGSILLHPEWRGIWIKKLQDLQRPGNQVLDVNVRG